MIENTVFIALSRQVALQRQLDVIANNIANMNTTAFKGQRMLFEEFVRETDDGAALSFVQDVAVARDMSDGEIRPTGAPLDLAISGAGYFVVDTPNGPQYTRNGQFRLDETSTLVTQDGRPVLDAQDNPLVLDTLDGSVTISKDGQISTALGPVGKLALVDFANPQALRSVGAGLYATDQAPLPAEGARVLQGMIESSNVEPILEITRMTEVMRGYQSTQRLMQTDDDMRRRAIQRLGRVT